MTNPDHSLPENWRASTQAGGSPGGDDSIPFVGDPGTDSDDDGWNDLLEFALGSSGTDPGSIPLQSVSAGIDGQFETEDDLSSQEP